jgi:hypothetical protein
LLGPFVRLVGPVVSAPASKAGDTASNPSLDQNLFPNLTTRSLV